MHRERGGISIYNLDYKITSFHILAGCNSMPLIVSCFTPRFYHHIHSAISWMRKHMVLLPYRFTGGLPWVCSRYQISSSFKHDKRINRSPLRYSHKKDQDQQMDFWFLTLILPKQTLRPDQLMPLSQMQLVNTQNHRKKLPLPGKLWGIENNNADYHRNWETVTSP